jgi:hypothetical protein
MVRLMPSANRLSIELDSKHRKAFSCGAFFAISIETFKKT